MNDPHVESLSYRLETEKGLEFEDPPPLEYEIGEFRLRLSNSALTVWPKKHHASEEAARQTVEPYLRAWELDQALQRNEQLMRFEFENAEVIDRAPSNTRAVELLCRVEGKVYLSVSATIIRKDYPEPPENFVVSPDTETLWRRYEQYLKGREPLLSMASFCLSFLHAKAGSRKKAAKMYDIDFEVLDNLGNLTANLGDELGARKVSVSSQNRAPTNREKVWIEVAVRTLVRRTGELAANSLDEQLPKIAMSDLPEL